MNYKQHYKIGITFSGKYRDKYVEPTCNALLDCDFSKSDIFYDKWHEAYINGVHGDNKLRNIYHNCCDLVVVLLSPDYKDRNWTGNIEWPAILELINTGKDDEICLLKVGTVNIDEIDGLYNYQAIVKPVDNLPPKEIAMFIKEKYLLVSGNP